MFDPKSGDKVIVCYDGKLGRAVDGIVKARRGFALLVEFKEWASDIEDKPVQNWFVRTSPESFGGFLRVKDSLMKMLVGTPGDWYSVFCPTQLAPDAGDSSVSTSSLQASALSTSQAESAPPQRG